MSYSELGYIVQLRECLLLCCDCCCVDCCTWGRKCHIMMQASQLRALSFTHHYENWHTMLSLIRLKVISLALQDCVVLARPWLNFVHNRLANRATMNKGINSLLAAELGTPNWPWMSLTKGASMNIINWCPLISDVTILFHANKLLQAQLS